jgi:GTP cyclohydrolase I
LEFHYREILKILGENVESEHLWKTPARAAKSIIFLTSGNQEKPTEVVNGAIYKNSNGKNTYLSVQIFLFKKVKNLIKFLNFVV